ncbi:Six-hairpin glycosidase [Rhizophagus irregularis]|uniref:Endoglucanase n=2 Tax=Rhizophagus irregularis TaxID=588596 RepID=A0A2I1FYT6_9GLOM|nr:Six-hairpin glycosidase [Rhizophagus irregularis]
MTTKIKSKVTLSLICFFLCMINIINAQEHKIVTLPGPEVEGIPETTDYPNNDYEKLLAYSLYFYEAQRSGILSATNRIPWRHNSAPFDGQKEGVDLTGGYYDAGDYMKFTYPLSWTLTSISWGGLEWFEGYELSGQTQYLHDMVKWGTDWLIKAYSLETNDLYVQVGREDVDHNYWGGDLNIPLPRDAYKVGEKNHGTDVASSVVAAFASASILFREKFSDSTYSDDLLLRAKALYVFAETKAWKLYGASSPQVNSLYPSSNYQDKLVWAALWLYKATGEEIYFNKAINFYTQFFIPDSIIAINWSDQTCAIYFLLVQITKGNELSYKLQAEKYLDYMLNPSLVPKSPCSYTPGGLLWCDGISDTNSLNVPLNIAFVSLLYAPYATTTEKRSKYMEFAQSQIKYVLGENPMKMTYVVGINPKSPKNPHHAGAHGSTTNNMLLPIETTNILYGAVVGGPSKKDLYIDDRTKYNSTEVALDYNAPWQGLMAYQVIYYKTNIPEKSRPEDGDDNDNDNEQNDDEHNENKDGKSKIAESNVKSGGMITSRIGGIIGIAIGSLILVLLGASLIWKRSMIVAWFKRDRKKRDIEFNIENNVTSRPSSFISHISRPNSVVVPISSVVVPISRSNSVAVPNSRPNSAISGSNSRPNSGAGVENYLSFFNNF